MAPKRQLKRWQFAKHCNLKARPTMYPTTNSTIPHGWFGDRRTLFRQCSRPNLHSACAKTAIFNFQLCVKILTLPLDSVTPISSMIYGYFQFGDRWVFAMRP